VPAPLLPGDPPSLGRYRLAGRLGSGGMGVVYLAHDPAGGPVAIKLVHAHLAGDPEFHARFRSEVNRVRQVPAFCTAEVLDANLGHHPPYLVVEYVDGPSLAEVVDRRGPLTPANLHSVAVGVATALAGIHGAGVIHRDLKPENVLLAPGSPKVIDFGIARAFEATSQHTRTDQFVGTVAYMAPERFSSEPGTALTAAADVFAWGCVIGYAGTGRTPFHADSAPATAARILTQRPALDGLAQPLRDVAEAALAKDPADRPTARELLELLVGGPGPAPAVAPPVRTGPVPAPAPPRAGRARVARRKRRARTRRTLAGLAAVLALAGGGAVAGMLASPGESGGPAGARPRSDGAAAGQSAPPAEPPGPAALPAQAKGEPSGGEPIVRDPLTRPGQWLDSGITGEDAQCVVRGMMIATRAGPGVFRCAGPEEVIADDFGVAVSAVLFSGRECASVWFHWDPAAGGHRADLCRTEVRVGADKEADRQVYGRLRLTPAMKQAAPERFHLVVRGRVVDVFRNGRHAGGVRLPAAEPTEGQVLLGLTTDAPAPRGAFRVAFSRVDVRSF
jgi:hypothetical protein